MAIGLVMLIFGLALAFFGVLMIGQWWDWTYNFFGLEVGTNRLLARIIGVILVLGGLGLLVAGVLKLAGVI